MRRLLAVVFLISTAAVVCFAGTPQSHSPRVSKTSRSRVLYASSPLRPLKPTQAVQITVNASAAYDSTTGLWTYEYSVKNEPTSQNVIETFALTPMRKAPIDILSPPHWTGFFNSDGDSNAVVWGVTEAGPAPPGWSGLDVFIGPYHPKPGQTVGGFKIISRQKPAPMSFYAQGFDTLPGGGEYGLPSPPTIFEEGVTGTTIGPATKGLVSPRENRVLLSPAVRVFVSKDTRGSLIRYRYRLANSSAYPISTLIIGNDDSYGESEITVPPGGWDAEEPPESTYTAPKGWQFHFIPVEGESLGALWWEALDSTKVTVGEESAADFSATISTPDVMYERGHWTVFTHDGSLTGAIEPDSARDTRTPAHPNRGPGAKVTPHSRH